MIDSTAALPVEDSPYHGYDIPWNYGRYRVVITRRVSEEEQVSIECYESTKEEARDTFSLFVHRLHEHMVEYNERVHNLHRHTVQTLEREIDLKAQRLHQLNEQIEEREATLNGGARED